MAELSLEEFNEQHRVLQSDPQRYLGMMDELVRQEPSNASSYFRRHHAWVRLGQPDKALDDLDRADALEPSSVQCIARGTILMDQGKHREALDALNDGEALDPPNWTDTWGPLYQADCHARLGDEAPALTALSRLTGDYYPGLHGTPRGTKAEMADELRHRAAKARSGSND